jgi:hypothetical protein
MKYKKIKTYKPKESNVVKLDTFLQKLNKDGKHNRLGKDIL